jgi:hypothetical protein
MHVRSRFMRSGPILFLAANLLMFYLPIFGLDIFLQTQEYPNGYDYQ